MNRASVRLSTMLGVKSASNAAPTSRTVMGDGLMIAFDSNRMLARRWANLPVVGLVFITLLTGCGGDPAGSEPTDADAEGDQASDAGAEGDQASDAGAKGDQATGAEGDQATDAGAKGDQATDATGCGLALFTNPTCQAWLDAHCCAEQRTCVGNCQVIVACINACPSPRTDTCVSNCAASGDIAALDAIGNCSKSAPPPPAGVTCAWP